MSTSPSDREGYLRRNLPPLIVGVAALVAIIGGLVVIVDRVLDDDDDGTRVIRVAEDTADRPFETLGSELDRMLAGLLEARPALGVTVMADDGRVTVERVLPGSPAAHAGIEVGDVIRDANGERVRSVEDLREAIASVEAGEEYELEIRRDGDDRTLTARRDAFPADALATLLQQFLAGGLDLQGLNLEGFDLEGLDLGQFDLERFGLDGRRQAPQFTPAPDPFAESRLRPTLGVTVVQTNEGLRVVGVEPGSIADEAGLRGDDIILAANGHRIRTIEDLRAVIPAFAPDGERDHRDAVIDLLILREGREQVLAAQFRLDGAPIEPGRRPSRPPNAEPAPEELTQRLMEELEDVRAFLESGALAEELEARLLDRLGAQLNEAIEAALDELRSELSEAIESVAPPPPAIAADELDVFRGTVISLTDGQIVLGGSLGSIEFDLTEDTAIVGATPRIGAISTVAATADRQAVLVLTPN